MWPVDFSTPVFDLVELEDEHQQQDEDDQGDDATTDVHKFLRFYPTQFVLLDVVADGVGASGPPRYTGMTSPDANGCLIPDNDAWFRP
jgi:hypothetical protein